MQYMWRKWFVLDGRVTKTMAQLPILSEERFFLSVVEVTDKNRPFLKITDISNPEAITEDIYLLSLHSQGLVIKINKLCGSKTE